MDSISPNAMLAMATAVVNNKGPTLHIPMANLEADFPEMQDQQAYLFGVVAIESARLRYDNRDIRAAFKASFENHDKADLANAVGQLMFDLVVERSQCQALPSTHNVLEAYWKLIYSRLDIGAKTPNWDASFARYVFARARHSVLLTDWTLNACGAAAQVMSTNFSPKEFDPIECELACLDQMATADDAAKIAYRLLDLVGVTPNQTQDNAQEAALGEAQPPDACEAQPGEDAPQDDTTQADGQGEGGEGPVSDTAQTPVDGPANGDDAAPAESPQPGDASTSEGTQSQAGQSAGASEQAPDAGTESTAGASSSTETLVAPLQQQKQPPDPPVGMTALAPVPGSGLADAGFERQHRHGQALRSKILIHTMMAGERLASLLKAQTQSTTRYGKKGQIVPARLWRLKMGNVSVFRNTVEGRELNTAVKILLDRSGSMKGSMQQAVEAACFLPMAFDDVAGIHTSIDIFPGYGKFASTLKPFDTRTMPCLDDLADVTASGGTPLTEALRHSGSDLMNFDAERRLLVIVTDGRPHREDLARAELRALEAAGIEVIGISINVSLRHLFSKYVSIQHVGELTNSLYHLMEAELIRDPLAA